MFDGGSRWDDARLNLLGVNDMKGVPPEGTSTLHSMLWKHVLIQMTMKSLKGVIPDIQQIINKAVLRLEKRVSSQEYEITCMYCKAESRSTPPNLRPARRRLKGIGEVLDSGKIQLHPDLITLLHIARL